jgi:tetratricopeptide (TPR) repeat protein
MREIHGAARALSGTAGQLDEALKLRSAGRLVEAVDLLANPGEYDPYLCCVRAEMEFTLGRFPEAALSYFSAAMSDPDDTDARFNLGLCLERCERWDVAAEAFEGVLQWDADRMDARLALGSCLLHLNRAEEALANFNQCGWGQAARAGRAVALQKLGRFDEAAAEYESLLASDPNSEEFLSNLIALGVETHDVEGVDAHAHRLLEINPQSQVALQGLATVAFHRWDHEAAAAYCGRILESAPECLEAWHNFRIAMDRSAFSVAESALAVYTGGKQ